MIVTSNINLTAVEVSLTTVALICLLYRGFVLSETITKITKLIKDNDSADNNACADLITHIKTEWKKFVYVCIIAICVLCTVSYVAGQYGQVINVTLNHRIR